MDERLAKFLQQTARHEHLSRPEIATPAGQPKPDDLAQTASGHLGYVVTWLGPSTDPHSPNANEPVCVIELMGELAHHAQQLPTASRYGFVPLSEIKPVRIE
jgi:hypothetical protein